MLVDISFTALSEVRSVRLASGVKVVAHMLEPDGDCLFDNSIKSISAYLDYLDKLRGLTVWVQTLYRNSDLRFLLELDGRLFDAVIVYVVPESAGDLLHFRSLANSLSSIIEKPIYIGLTLSSAHLLDALPTSRVVLAPLVLTGNKLVRVPLERRYASCYVKVSLEEYTKLRPERPIVEVRDKDELEVLKYVMDPRGLSLVAELDCEYASYCMDVCPDVRVEGENFVIPLRSCPKCAILLKLCDRAEIFNEVEVL